MEQMFRLEYTLSATFYDGSHTCGYFHSLFSGSICFFEKRESGPRYLQGDQLKERSLHRLNNKLEARLDYSDESKISNTQFAKLPGFRIFKYREELNSKRLSILRVNNPRNMFTIR